MASESKHDSHGVEGDGLVPVHLRVPSELKSEWIVESRKEGKKLNDWVVGRVNGPHEVFDFLFQLGAAQINVSNINELVRQLVTSSDWRHTLTELAEQGRKVNVLFFSSDPGVEETLRRVLRNRRFDESQIATITRNIHASLFPSTRTDEQLQGGD
jgi:hypothetical protein